MGYTVPTGIERRIDTAVSFTPSKQKMNIKTIIHVPSVRISNGNVIDHPIYGSKINDNFSLSLFFSRDLRMPGFSLPFSL